MKSAVVTGANGFVGRHLTAELTSQGYKVWAVVRDRTSDVEGLRDSAPELVYCTLDNLLSLPDKLPAEAAGSCFYHLAWSGSSGAARGDYALQLRNATGCANAAAAAGRIGCTRFVGAGSVTQLMYRDYLRRDDCKPERIVCYAVGKIAAEYMARCICADNGVGYIWAYISNFYGAGDPTNNLINFLIREYLQDRTPELTDGTQGADFMYVSDVARALTALGSKGTAGSSYYVGYGSPHPLREFVTSIRDLVAPELPTGLGRKEFHGLPVDFEHMDIQKLARDTGFSPQVSFEEGIWRTVDWMRRRQEVR